MLTMVEAAAELNGRQYGDEECPELFARMKEAELVAVFGWSEDLMEFRGAVDDEKAAWGGGVAYFTKAGLLENVWREDAALDPDASLVRAIWDPEADGDARWKMETTLPISPFLIKWGDEPYCVGLVFSLNDCP